MTEHNAHEILFDGARYDVGAGLTTEQVASSRAKYGRNELTPPERAPWWRELLEGFDDPTIKILLGAACRLGAIIAGASPANEQAIYNAGVNMGLAFQLQDDLLDVWGDPEVFGKETGGDIMNNNKTFLLISAIRLADDITKTELRRWLNDPYALREQKVPAVTAIYERLGLKQLTVNKIEQYNAEAVKLVKSTGMSPDDADRFISLIHSLTSRNA